MASDNYCINCPFNDGGEMVEQCLHCRHLMAYDEPTGGNKNE